MESCINGGIMVNRENGRGPTFEQVPNITDLPDRRLRLPEKLLDSLQFALPLLSQGCEVDHRKILAAESRNLVVVDGVLEVIKLRVNRRISELFQRALATSLTKKAKTKTLE